MISIFRWMMLVVAAERATELVVSSKIFEPLRSMVKRWVYSQSENEPPPDTLVQHFKIMLDYLLHCGYCVSVWIGALFALFAERNFESSIVNWIISSLFIHGMSNIYHVLYELIRRGRIRTYDIKLSVDDGDNRENGV